MVATDCPAQTPVASKQGEFLLHQADGICYSGRRQLPDSTENINTLQHMAVVKAFGGDEQHRQRNQARFQVEATRPARANQPRAGFHDLARDAQPLSPCSHTRNSNPSGPTT